MKESGCVQGCVKTADVRGYVWACVSSGWEGNGGLLKCEVEMSTVMLPRCLPLPESGTGLVKTRSETLNTSDLGAPLFKGQRSECEKLGPSHAGAFTISWGQ